MPKKKKNQKSYFPTSGSFYLIASHILIENQTGSQMIFTSMYKLTYLNILPFAHFIICYIAPIHNLKLRRLMLTNISHKCSLNVPLLEITQVSGFTFDFLKFTKENKIAKKVGNTCPFES